MADVKWIKITTDVFDDEKILLIESLPDAYAIIVVWFKLLCLAGKQNNSGVFMMGQIAYTDKMLATIFRMKESTVTMALQTFKQFGMIEIIDGVITIPNWNKHQTLDAYEKKKERDRIYQQERRAAQKALIAGSSLCETGLPLKDWVKVLKEFDYECAYCGKEGNLEQEHIIPIKKGGKYEIGNIIPACRHCNASKGDRDFQRWYINSDVFDIERFNHIKKYMESSDKSSFVAVSDKEEDKDKEKELDIRDIISDSDESATPAPGKKTKSDKPVKHKYGEYKNVLLTDEELQKLKSEYSDYEERIERLSSYVASTGKAYKSHYATIRNWARKDAEKPGRKEMVPSWMGNKKKSGFNSFQQNQYDFGSLEDELLANGTKTAGNDPDVAARAEALKRQLGGA